MNSFEYEGLIFTPKRYFSPKERKVGLRLPLWTIGMNVYDSAIRNYCWDDFYAAAAAANHNDCQMDVFDYNGYEVVPCVNELFHLNYHGEEVYWNVPRADNSLPKCSIINPVIVKVMFGDQEVKRYYEGELTNFEPLVDAFIKEYRFENEAQAKAFEMGLEAMYGQLEYAILC